ncbi:MAG: S-methyl-5-thioribose-1-phosphate isomerase [Gemmatimonadota bacterium]|jgi:methylthioribose-1-phosphate isomerase|nr:S-methyl-5-thioribose-1-phosphate isomerase [Gemmatimonadota bacterium]MDP6802409.1 S-methyl-5-thioribose-1-phosphate isomerase [Gemmatimonadota bacterium]
MTEHSPPGAPFSTVRWEDGVVHLLEQTLLPEREEELPCRTPEEIADAIRRLAVRGAPAIGVAAGYGAALAAHHSRATDPAAFVAEVEAALALLRAARPTAVNLPWAVDRMRASLQASEGGSIEERKAALLDEARRIHAEDAASCRAMGRLGAALLPTKGTVLTHCNAGALATGGRGTALAVIYAAVEDGKAIRVLADETRPLLQGARLTAWELARFGVPVTLLCDNAAGSALSRGMVDCVVVGSDRIAANGDVANKIGTYPLAVLAREHDIPFFVVAPLSTVDPATPSGEGIPIEERAPEEVTEPRGVRFAPLGVNAFNPAFDVTPARFVTAIVTDRGIARAPYGKALRALAEAPPPVG